MKSLQMERVAFNELKKKYGAAKIVPAPGYLRIEQVIDNNKSVYRFNPKQDSNSDSITEVKLDKNDKFFVTGLGLFLLREDKTKVGGQALQSFPNKAVFPDVATKFLCEDLESVYNGWLTLKTGAVINIPQFPALAFRQVPQTQANVTVASPSYNQFSLDNLLYVGAEDITLNGGATQSFELTIPPFAGKLIAAPDTTPTIVHKVVLFATGFILRGAGDNKA